MFVVIVTHLVTQPMTPCHLTWRWVLTLKGQCAGARLYRLGPTWTTAGVGDVDDRDDDPDQHVEITRVPSCGVVRSRRRRYAPPLARPYHEATYPASRWRGARRMAVTSASSLLSGEAVRAGLTGIFSVFRSALEEETGTGRRTTTPVVRDGARDAR